MMIDSAVFAYNTSSHESTSYSPFEVIFGRKARIPINADLKSISELFSFIFVTEIFNTFKETKHSQPRRTCGQTL